jgi:NAD(P)-dependent dehydrogenase (short-subunit alcohol dehydrogenase family)
MTFDTPPEHGPVRPTINPGRTAIITGGSAGLGRALAQLLASSGWRLVVDARHEAPLAELAAVLSERTDIVTVPGDVADPDHRRRLIEVAGPRIGLLVNNASELGPSPLSTLRTLQLDALESIWQVNVAAPLALVQQALPALVPGAAVIDISSDAAIEHYQTWGGYGATKAALDHLTLTFAAEEPGFRFYAVDPGDMRTAMHQAAFPGEDISDRPDPAEIAPRLIGLVDSDLPSGRYRAVELPDPRLTLAAQGNQ